MEFFLDFCWTIVLSLFSSFLLAKLFSLLSVYDHDLEKRIIPDHKFQKEFKDYDFGKETRSGLVSEILGVDELDDQSIENKILSQQEFSMFVHSKDPHDSIFKGDETLDLVKEGCDQQKEFKILDLKQGGYGESVECGYINESFDGSCERGTERKEIEKLKKEEVGGEIEEEKNDDADWEGIERSELERLFGSAVAYVSSSDKRSLSSDLKLQLHGLHRVAIEGPCLVPQPNALKFSARAKWNAWQKLGNMNPEAAMEQYINLLGRNIPGWMKD